MHLVLLLLQQVPRCCDNDHLTLVVVTHYSWDTSFLTEFNLHIQFFKYVIWGEKFGKETKNATHLYVCKAHWMWMYEGPHTHPWYKYWLADSQKQHLTWQSSPKCFGSWSYISQQKLLQQNHTAWLNTRCSFRWWQVAEWHSDVCSGFLQHHKTSSRAQSLLSQRCHPAWCSVEAQNLHRGPAEGTAAAERSCGISLYRWIWTNS